MATINPDMVTLARELRGYSQKELSQKVGITQGGISKLELGLMTLREDVLSALAEAVEFPKSFFFQKENLFEPNLYYRKKYRTTKKILTKAKAEMNLYRISIHQFMKCVDLEMPEIPYFDVDSDGSPETIAYKLREFWGVPKGPIRNLISLFESKGIIVIQADFENDDLIGAGMFTKDKVPIIYVNKFMPMDRQRFTICHELFHIIAHVYSSVEEHRNIEKEANLFAGSFLMPAQDIKPHLLGRLTLQKLSNLKKYWFCAMSAILIRAQQINAVTQRHAKTLWIQMGKLGFRKREPPELEPPKETPNIIKVIIETIKNELEYSDEEIYKILNLNKELAVQKFYEPEKPKLKISIGGNMNIVK